MDQDARRANARLARENTRLAEERARLEEETVRLRLELDRLSTELEASRRELDRAGEARSRFVGSVSHQLRTPLNAILGYVELMEKGVPVPLPPETRTYLGRVSSSAKQVGQLIEGIAELSRLEDGRETVDLRPVSVSEIVQRVEGLSQPLAVAAGIELRTRVPEEPVIVETDARKIQRILVNLVGNAIKFTERGSAIVTVAPRDAGARIEVEDTGIGIPDDQLERVFEPFRQVGPAPRATDPGVGLGLAVVRELVQLLGARIEVSSREGEGTLFVVDLPPRPDHGSVASPPPRR